MTDKLHQAKDFVDLCDGVSHKGIVAGCLEMLDSLDGDSNKEKNAMSRKNIIVDSAGICEFGRCII
jgi:hypothetical protein